MCTEKSGSGHGVCTLALPAMCQRPGPASSAIEMDRREVDAEHVHVEIREDVELEVELRHEIADRVEAESALDARDADVGPDAQRGAGLNRRRRDREVALELDADDADVEAGADAIERHRNVGRHFLEARMEAAGADEERRLVAELRAERELAGDADAARRASGSASRRTRCAADRTRPSRRNRAAGRAARGRRTRAAAAGRSPGRGA